MEKKIIVCATMASIRKCKTTDSLVGMNTITAFLKEAVNKNLQVGVEQDTKPREQLVDVSQLDQLITMKIYI